MAEEGRHQAVKVARFSYSAFHEKHPNFSVCPMVYTGVGATNAINNFQLESPRLIAVSLSGPRRFIEQTSVETTIAQDPVPESIDLPDATVRQSRGNVVIRQKLTFSRLSPIKLQTIVGQVSISSRDKWIIRIKDETDAIEEDSDCI